MSSRSQRTRTAILDAAWKRLSRPGDPARLEDIAEDAGVTRQSIYMYFRSRSGLLTAVVEHIDTTLGLPERLAEIAACADPVEALMANLRLTASYQPKIQGVAMALMRLAPTDRDAAAALEDRMQMRRDGLLVLLRALARRGLLAPGWTPKRAADALWEAGAPSSYEHLVVERGWRVQQWQRWLTHLASSLLTTASRG